MFIMQGLGQTATTLTVQRGRKPYTPAAVELAPARRPMRMRRRTPTGIERQPAFEEVGISPAAAAAEILAAQAVGRSRPMSTGEAAAEIFAARPLTRKEKKRRARALYKEVVGVSPAAAAVEILAAQAPREPTLAEKLKALRPIEIRKAQIAREEAAREKAALRKADPAIKRIVAKATARRPRAVREALRREPRVPGLRERRTSRILLQRLLRPGGYSPYATFATPAEFLALRRRRRGAGRFAGMGSSIAERAGWLVLIKSQTHTQLTEGLENVGTHRPAFILPNAETMPAPPPVGPPPTPPPPAPPPAPPTPAVPAVAAPPAPAVGITTAKLMTYAPIALAALMFLRK